MKQLLLGILSILISGTIAAQPPNDNCWQADTVVVAPGATVTVTGNNEGATDAINIGVPHVWEAFTLTECSDLIISYCGTDPAFTTAHRTLYTGCTTNGFGNFARHPDTGIEQTSCGDNNFTIPYFQLPAGTYFYLVESLPGATGDYTLNFTATPCSATPPANDECAGAITLVPNETCVTVTGDVDGANAGVSLPPITCNGWTGDSSDDVWFQFVATAESHDIMVTPGPGMDPTVDLRSGICGATETIACAENTGTGAAETLQATGLTIGETYYIRVNDWWAGLSLTTTFDICVMGAGGGDCEAFAGSFGPVAGPTCLVDGSAILSPIPTGDAVVPEGFSTIYLLSIGDDAVLQTSNVTASFTVNDPGTYTVHTLVFDESTLDTSLFVAGTTTIAEIYALLQQGGGEICGSIDVTGATIEVIVCEPCDAFAGTLTPVIGTVCLIDGIAGMEAILNNDAVIPTGYQQVFVLTQGPDMVILEVSITPVFEIGTVGSYTIHSLVFDPATLNLSDIVIGSTTAAEVNAMLQQGGGTICASLDLAGAAYEVEDCTPANDLCTNAQGLNIYATGDCAGNEVSGSNIFSTAGTISPACDPSTVGFADVYYVFNSGANTEVTIDLTGVTMENWGIAVFTDCTGDGPIACEISPAAPIIVTTTPDTDHIIMIYSDLEDGQTGDFNICLTGSVAVNFCLGGSVSTDLGEDEAVICVNDPVGSIAFMNTGGGAQDYSYILTDSTGIIVASSVGNTIDITDLAIGTYQVHGVSFNGTLEGATAGASLAGITSTGECISMSTNFVTLIVEVCTSIESSSSIDWSIFPNPANDVINITYNGEAGNAVIEMYDASGRRVIIERIQLIAGANQPLSVGALAPGMYTISISTELGRSTARVIVE